MKNVFIGLFCFWLTTLSAVAQNYFPLSQEKFGKNRVQYKEFSWKTIKSNNFEVNFYRGGEELARKAAMIAEGDFNRITDILGYTPFTTMKLFIYNSPGDMTQSNIGLTAPITFDGSILNLSRSRVEIAYPGNDEAYREEIIQQVAKLFVYDMLYGGSLKEVLQSSLMLTVPEWYMSGIARYIAHDNNDPAELDSMRTAIVNLQDRKLKTLEGKDAAIIGQSIWNYIARRYGEDNISNILNLTRIIRDEQSSITSTLGVSYNRFLSDWKNYYLSGQYTQTETPETRQPDAAGAEKTTVKTTDYPPLTNLKPGEVDTENYVFDPESLQAFKADTTRSSVYNSNNPKSISDYKRAPEKIVLSEPKAYQNLLIMNDIKTDFVNDPIRRIGMRNTLMLNDMLENNIFNFSLYLSPQLKSHDISASYTNTTKRIDWGLSFFRRSIYIEDINNKNYYILRPLGVYTPPLSQNMALGAFRRVYYHRFEGLISYPFSNYLRVSGSPFFVNTTDVDYDELNKANLNDYYGGLKIETVFDNSRQISQNVEVGTKALMRYERYVGLGGTRGFSRLNFDIRHYQHLVKGVVLAGRFSYGTSGGNAPKITFLGGTENALNRTIQAALGQNLGVPSDLRPIAFYNFAGNLRGFNFAKIFGNNHLLANLELRLSVSEFMSQGAVSSNSLKNLQLVSFYDLGTAWMGSYGPFSRQNSLNTEIIGGGTNPFRAVVTNFKNPFLMGYGFGARTTIFGYVVRADYAWGVEDKDVSSPVFHLSLGHDF